MMIQSASFHPTYGVLKCVGVWSAVIHCSALHGKPSMPGHANYKFRIIINFGSVNPLILSGLWFLSKWVRRAWLPWYLDGVEKLVPETCGGWRNKVEIGQWRMAEWHGRWWNEMGGWSKAVCRACYLDRMEKLALKTCDGWRNEVGRLIKVICWACHLDRIKIGLEGLWLEWRGGWWKQLGIGWQMAEWGGGWRNEVADGGMRWGGWSKTLCWACHLDGMEKLDLWRMAEWHGGWWKQFAIDI